MLNRSVRSSLLLSVLPGLLLAQATSVQVAGGDTLPRPPADRIEELFRWSAGGSIDIDGLPSWRGRSLAGAERTVDGILWGSLVRSDRYSTTGQLRPFAPSLNALASAEVLGSGYGASIGGAAPGSLAFQTRGGSDRWEFDGSAGTGAALDAAGTDGVTRLDASVGGPILPGWRFRAVGSVLGRPTAGLREGEGRYYVPAGIDTTYRYEIAPGDSAEVDVLSFVSTERVPRSPRTTGDLMARLDGTVGRATVWFRALRGTEAERYFDYEHVAHTAQTFGREGRQHDIAAGGSATLPAGVTLRAHLAWQEEQLHEGPIDPTADAETRDPAFGILTGGMPLRFTTENFAVDEELEWNYRLNTPGSRRTPYDLENRDQYSITDEIRNNAYGVNGFTESGGPLGRLRLYQDRRLEIGAAASLPAGVGIATVGVFQRTHKIANYSHELAAQALSDVWLASPVEQAVFAEWRAAGASWQVNLGARLDRFDTRARRPRLFPRLSSIGTYVDPESGDTLRWDRGSLDQETWYRLNTDPDEAHTALSLRASAAGDVTPTLRVHVAAGRHARTPDLALQLAGINTDLSNSNTSQVWGTDYGHEIIDAYEAGIRVKVAALDLGITGYGEREVQVEMLRARSVFDPLTTSNRVLAFNEANEGSDRFGVIVSAAYRVGQALTLGGSYNYVSVDDGIFGPTIRTEPRPHTLTLAAEGRTRSSGPLGGITAMVAFQQATGIARLVDDGAFPFPTTDVRTGDIPPWRTLDARAVKRFALSGRALAVYVDARNILDARNLVTAFDGGSLDAAPAREAQRLASDLSDLRNEGEANGLYDAGTIDLTFGGAGRAGCGGWRDQDFQPAPANCAYLIGAEARFGDGDGRFTAQEQARASMALYRAEMGAHLFRGAGRAVRIGAQFAF